MLVVIVIILFLQTWRAAIIPIVAIPVSLIGTFFVMKAFGFSLNNLTLFGLVLAIGIVVDDAIVVVENVERYLRQGLSPRDAAHKTMDEVGGALVAIALVLCAVFIPTAFITGISGEFYRQFALTIAASTIISAFVSSDVVARACRAVPAAAWPRSAPGFWKKLSFRSMSFLRASTGYSKGCRFGYAGLTRRALARVGANACDLWRPHRADLFSVRPHAVRIHSATRPRLLHNRDFIAAGLRAWSARTASCARQRTSCSSRPGVAHAVTFAGFDGATFTNAPNYGRHFCTLKPFEERVKARLATADDIERSCAGRCRLCAKLPCW